jgi:hypothetical protein
MLCFIFNLLYCIPLFCISWWWQIKTLPRNLRGPWQGSRYWTKQCIHFEDPWKFYLWMLKDYQRALENLGNIHVLEPNNIFTLRKRENVKWMLDIKELWGTYTRFMFFNQIMQSLSTCGHMWKGCCKTIKELLKTLES